MLAWIQASQTCRLACGQVNSALKNSRARYLIESDPAP